MKKIKKLLLSLIVFFLLTNLAAPTIVSVQASPVKLNKKTATIIKGQTLSLKLKKARGKINWKSLDNKIAVVSRTGKVIGKKKGITTIIARNKRKNYKCKVIVQTPTLNHKNLTMTAGQSIPLKFNGTNQKARWKSANSNVAVINNKGVVKAIKTGFTTINANIMGVTYTCKITVKTSDNNQIEPLPQTPVPQPQPTAPQPPSSDENNQTGVRIILPDFPQTFYNYNRKGEVKASYRLTDITYNTTYYSYNNTYTAYIYFEGTKLFDLDGPNKSSAVVIGWKLYKNGAVIDSGTTRTPAILINESFAKEKVYAFNLDAGDYELKILSTY
jgi:hypothetical protein